MNRARLRQPLRAITALAAVALITAGCAGGDGDGAEPLTTLRVGLIQSVDQVIIPVLEEEGFAEEQGLRLEITTVAGGRAAMEALAAGSLDVAFAGTLPVLSAARAGVMPGEVIALGATARADADHPGITVVAAEPAAWADLAGQPIGVNQVGSIGEVAMRLRLQQEGVVPGPFVEIAFPNQGLALAGGQVAAAVMVEPYVTQSVARGDGAVLDHVIGGGEPFPRMDMAFIAMRADLVRDQPETVRAYLRAHLDAVDWIDGNEADARVLIARRLGIDRSVAEAMSTAGLVPDARIDEHLLASIQATLAAFDPALTPVPSEQLYDMRLLDEVLASR